MVARDAVGADTAVCHELESQLLKAPKFMGNCVKKRRFGSRQRAKMGARNIERRYTLRHGTLHVYRCPICDFWHLTSCRNGWRDE